MSILVVDDNIVLLQKVARSFAHQTATRKNAASNTGSAPNPAVPIF